MDGTKTLRDYLLDPVESERLEAVRLLLSQIESAARALELMTEATKARHEGIALLFDLEALRQQASALKAYCFNHYAWISLDGEHKIEKAESTIAELPAASELRH